MQRRVAFASIQKLTITRMRWRHISNYAGWSVANILNKPAIRNGCSETPTVFYPR